MTNIYEIRADKYNADPEHYDAEYFPLHEPLISTLESLTPYLCENGESFVTSRAWYDGQHAHIVVSVECEPKDHSDMISLLLVTTQFYADFCEITTSRAEVSP